MNIYGMTYTWMIKCLKHFGETIDDIIENNDEEGYGLTPAEIQELKDEYGLEAEEIEETVS